MDDSDSDTDSDYVYSGNASITRVSHLDADELIEASTTLYHLAHAGAEIGYAIASGGAYLPVLYFPAWGEYMDAATSFTWDDREKIGFASACPVDIRIVDSFGNVYDKDSTMESQFYAEGDFFNTNDLHDFLILNKNDHSD